VALLSPVSPRALFVAARVPYNEQTKRLRTLNEVELMLGDLVKAIGITPEGAAELRSDLIKRLAPSSTQGPPLATDPLVQIGRNVVEVFQKLHEQKKSEYRVQLLALLMHGLTTDVIVKHFNVSLDTVFRAVRVTDNVLLTATQKQKVPRNYKADLKSYSKDSDTGRSRCSRGI